MSSYTWGWKSLNTGYSEYYPIVNLLKTKHEPPCMGREAPCQARAALGWTHPVGRGGLFSLRQASFVMRTYGHTYCM